MVVLMRVGFVGVTVLFWLILDQHVEFSSCKAAAHDFGCLQARAYVERGCRFFKHSEGHARIHQSTQQHVAAYARKTLEITNSHRVAILNGAGLN